MALAADGRRSAQARGIPGMADRGFQARIRDWQNGQVFHEERTRYRCRRASSKGRVALLQAHEAGEV